MTTTPNEEPRKTSLSDIPWKPILATMGVSGAAHLVGYLASGAISKGISKIPQVSRYWNRLPLGKQKAVATAAIGLAGTMLPLAVMGQQLASQAHWQEAQEDQVPKQGEKVASVIMVYRIALENLRG